MSAGFGLRFAMEATLSTIDVIGQESIERHPTASGDRKAAVALVVSLHSGACGWTLDPQFETETGSPCLLAHGLGRPVDDARTSIELAESGEYHVRVRAKDWVPSHHCRFAVSLQGQRPEREFGPNGLDWSWEPEWARGRRRRRRRYSRRSTAEEPSTAARSITCS